MLDLKSFRFQRVGLWLSQRPGAQPNSRRTQSQPRIIAGKNSPAACHERTRQTKPKATAERDRLLLFQRSYVPSRYNKQGGIHQKGLTGYFQRRVSANSLSEVIAGNTSVNTLIWFAAASMNDAQEKQRARGQQHAVGAWIVSIRLHMLAVFVPHHCGRGPTICLAVQGRRLAL